MGHVLNQINDFNKRGFSGQPNQPFKDLISMDQTHSNKVVFLSRQESRLVYQSINDMNYSIENEASYPILDDSFAHPNATPFTSLRQSVIVPSDAVITKEFDVILSVKTADCVPIIMIADPYIAVIHSGRVGTITHITTHVCRTLKELQSASPIIWFGPHSCVMCYEIDSDTHTHFDLLNENLSQVKAVFGDDIDYDISPYCTQCHHDTLFSYRMGDHINRNVFYLEKDSTSFSS